MFNGKPIFHTLYNLDGGTKRLQIRNFYYKFNVYFFSQHSFEKKIMPDFIFTEIEEFVKLM
jgi:hypothetical protein